MASGAAQGLQGVCARMGQNAHEVLVAGSKSTAHPRCRRAIGWQRKLKTPDSGSPRTVSSPLTGLAKNLQTAYLCLLHGISL